MTGQHGDRVDADISPMEAQNEGQGRRGSSSDGPLPETGTEKTRERREAVRTPVRKGGEDESRDDL